MALFVFGLKTSFMEAQKKRHTCLSLILPLFSFHVRFPSLSLSQLDPTELFDFCFPLSFIIFVICFAILFCGTTLGFSPFASKSLWVSAVLKFCTSFKRNGVECGRSFGFSFQMIEFLSSIFPKQSFCDQEFQSNVCRVSSVSRWFEHLFGFFDHELVEILKNVFVLMANWNQMRLIRISKSGCRSSLPSPSRSDKSKL